MEPFQCPGAIEPYVKSAFPLYGLHSSTGLCIESETCEFIVRGPFEKFVDWRQCAAVMQREAVTIMPSCSGAGNVVVA
jgi:hypothetical protein